MSQVGFQRSLARLVTDPAFRDAVRAAGERRLPAALSALERRRLVAAAADPGLDVTRLLHKGFRLGKLRSVLPLTCTLLGSRRLAREVARFWEATPATSFYYLAEAAAFCAHLRRRLRRGLRVRYLGDVVAYEAARLALEEHPVAGRRRVRVRFGHDPARLLGPLRAGRRPRGLRVCRYVLEGTRDTAGEVAWRVVVR